MTICITVRDGLICITGRDGLICMTVRDGLICITVRDGLICITVRDGLICMVIEFTSTYTLCHMIHFPKIWCLFFICPVLTFLR